MLSMSPVRSNSFELKMAAEASTSAENWTKNFDSRRDWLLGSLGTIEPLDFISRFLFDKLFLNLL